MNVNGNTVKEHIVEHEILDVKSVTVLDTRYIEVAGGNSAANIIIENDYQDGDISFKVNDGGVDTTVMTLDGATGNVGIGTTGPSYLLDIQTSGAINPILNIYTSNGAKYPELRLGHVNQTFSYYLDGSNNAFYIKDVTAGTYPFGIEAGSPGNSFYIKAPNGYLGYGMAAPDTRIHIRGGGGITIDPSSGGYTAGHKLNISANYANEGMIITYGGHKLISSFGYDTPETLAFSTYDTVTTASVERMRIHNGNVGIGVTDPDSKLEVFGSTGLKISFDATDNTTLVTDTAGNMTISPSGTEVGVAGDIKAIGTGATGLILYDTTLAGYYRVTLDNGSLVITAI